MVVPVGHDGGARDHRLRRDPLLVDPQARRQGRRRARPHQRDLVQDPGRQGGHSSRASAPSCAATATPTCAPRSRPSRPTSTRPGRERQARDIEAVRQAARRAAQGSAKGSDSHVMEAGTAAARAASSRGRRSSSAGSSPSRAAGCRWLTTTDHKKIGILYLFATFLFFILGGVEALIMRLQLAQPDNTLVDARDLQRARHDARHDDDLPVRRAGAGRLRQLPRAADDRRARHGLPAAERALVLAAAVRRDRLLHAASSSSRRRPAGRCTRRSRTTPSRPAAASTPGSS